jgi:hypothetical protein
MATAQMAAVIDRLGLFVRLSFVVVDLNMICLLCSAWSIRGSTAASVAAVAGRLQAGKRANAAPNERGSRRESST